MKYFVLCNPISGNGAGKKAEPIILDALKQKGISCQAFVTERPGAAAELARRAADEGADTVIVIGGDGTLHEAAAGLINTKTALGIIPTGTGNDFVKTIGTPVRPQEALNAVLTFPPRPTDTLLVNDMVCLNEAGMGFDVMVLDYAEKAKKRVKGLLPYLYGVIRTIFNYHDVRISYSVDGGPETERDALVFAMGNGRFIGGGIPIAPKAAPDDGLIDVLVLKGMKKTRMLRVLTGLLKGRIMSFQETDHCLAKAVTVRSPGMRVNIDGEIVRMDEARVRVCPGSLLVHRP